ncbi:MAG: hypothetical protein QOE92_2072 [Chloroflexota bacterium]|nr:hypothetical protein [Chloroflexota bacterium]
MSIGSSWRAGVALVLLASTLAACDLPVVGGSPAAGEEARSPEQLLADAKQEIAGLKTVELLISGTDSDLGAVSYDISLDADGAATGTGTAGDARFEVVVAGGRSYVKGRDVFALLFRDVPAGIRQATLDRVGDHWVVGADLLAPQDTNNNLRPAALADCLDAHGTLSKGPTVDVGGRRSVEVIDRGENPGGTPRSLFVAVDAPHVITRIRVNGDQTPGPGADRGRCKGSTATPAAPASPLPSGAPPPSRPTIDLKDYGKPVTVVVPTDTVEFSAVLPTGGF